MSTNIAIETLVKERDRVILEKNAAIDRFDQQINEIEAAIKRLSGKNVDEAASETIYDDESPDYIRQSVEEI